MTDKGEQISELLKSSGKSSADMTHSLKELGGGSMQDGLTRIGEYFEEENEIAANENYAAGEVAGTILGATGAALVVVGICLVKKIIKSVKEKKNKKQAHEQEGEKILNSIKQDPAIPGSLTSNADDIEETSQIDN